MLTRAAKIGTATTGSLYMVRKCVYNKGHLSYGIFRQRGQVYSVFECLQSKKTLTIELNTHIFFKESEKEQVF